MALIFPDPLPTYIEEDPLRKAECRVYYALKKQLNDDFLIFYSRPWLGLEADGKEIDGEIDFTVAHEKLGILSIEVKGGIISRNGQTDQWTSTDRFGIIHNIKNPVLQASTGKYHLLQKLKDSPHWQNKFINIHHGVVFPGSGRPGNNLDLGADMPLNIFAFGEDMKKLGSWVEKRMNIPDSQAKSGKIEPLGKDGLKALRLLLASSFQLRTNLGTVFSIGEQKIIQLSDEQFHVLDDLEHNNKLAVAGAAGTGKTLLALEKARRLAQEGKKTLFTCYNRTLAAYLSSLVNQESELTIMTFHQLCSFAARESGIELAEKSKFGDSTFYTQILPDALIDSLSINSDLRFDAIIVDEGQDFLPEWWDALQLAIKDEKHGVIYVFYDDNQRVYGHKTRIASGLPQLSYRLTRNLRNTREIFQAAVPWYKGGITRPAGPNGKEVEWLSADTKREQIILTKKILGELVHNENIPIEDIGIICSSSAIVEELCKSEKIGQYSVCSIEKPEKNHIVVDTIRRFKGLERNVIIIPLLEQLTEPELIYVALSRARLYLVVIGNSNDIGILRSEIE